MDPIIVTGTLEQIEIGATGVTEIIQNVKTIVSTVKGSVPLDRTFGVTGQILDQPLPVAKALYTAEIVCEVERQEPRVKVVRVTFDKDSAAALDGKLIPRVHIKIKEGVL